MKTTTRQAKKGEKICSFCGGDYILKEGTQTIPPGTIRGFHSEITFEYMLEFSECDTCGTIVILQDSIIKNENRLKEAKKQATALYRMKKWLET